MNDGAEPPPQEQNDTPGREPAGGETLPFLHKNAFFLADELLAEAQGNPFFEDFGPYKVDAKPIGSGGMGDVFPAQDTSTNRRVAIKFL